MSDWKDNWINAPMSVALTSILLTFVLNYFTKKKMEDKTIWQKQISEENDFSLIKSVDANKKFVEHPNVELRFFKHNRKDEWENILDKLNSEIQAKYPQTVFVGENKEKIKQNFIYELERSG